MNNNINYGNLVADFPLGGSSSSLFPGQIEIWKINSCGKNKPLTQPVYDIHMMPGLGMCNMKAMTGMTASLLLITIKVYKLFLLKHIFLTSNDASMEKLHMIGNT